MNRDMNAVRQLLFSLERGPEEIGDIKDLDITGFSDAQLRHTLELLKDAGFIVARDLLEDMPNHAQQKQLRRQQAIQEGRSTILYRLTWQGHDFLDAIRDPKIWSETTKGVEAAGGFTFDLLKDLAKAFLKRKIEGDTGIKL